MDKRIIRNQITAIRVMLDNIERELEEAPQTQPCDHREIKNLTTMGGPEEWRCLQCGFHYKETQNLNEE